MLNGRPKKVNVGNLGIGSGERAGWAVLSSPMGGGLAGGRLKSTQWVEICFAAPTPHHSRMKNLSIGPSVKRFKNYL